MHLVQEAKRMWLCVYPVSQIICTLETCKIHNIRSKPKNPTCSWAISSPVLQCAVTTRSPSSSTTFLSLLVTGSLELPMSDWMIPAVGSWLELFSRLEFPQDSLEPPSWSPLQTRSQSYGGTTSKHSPRLAGTGG